MFGLFVNPLVLPKAVRITVGKTDKKSLLEQKREFLCPRLNFLCENEGD